LGHCVREIVEPVDLTRQRGAGLGVESFCRRSTRVRGETGNCIQITAAIQTMEVASAGANPPNPAELIESKAMSEVLSRLTERYDLVVLDTAPLGVIADAFPLLREADGLIAVTQLGRSTRDSAERMREQLDRLEAPPLGIVANGIKARRGGRYGYGYYGPPEERQGATASAQPLAGAAAQRRLCIALRSRCGIVCLCAPRGRRAVIASATWQLAQGRDRGGRRGRCRGGKGPEWCASRPARPRVEGQGARRSSRDGSAPR
jgi:hypothetical protein